MRVAARNGFTLIEMMIAVAIIGILASIAYPSYTEHIKKSNRAAAQAHLVDIAQHQTRYLIDNRAYASTVALLGLSTPEKVASLYTVQITVADALPPAYTVTATPRTGTAQASDVVLSIDSAGTKSPSSKW
ncbi:type IV pilin protein [Noviherbaspirillum aerium]|uniref:type IV pilin protein n=1 Tax=Noviherbaspirillum aerium TaxID=2588497 RepID=UPI00124EC645|nr:type IV pilin protein [Noviherbaspirillum aerium]